MQSISPYLFLCNIYSNIIFSSKRITFNWSLSSNQQVSPILFPAWVLHVSHILSHVDCRPWQDMWMIKNYKTPVTYFSSVSFRFFSLKTSIFLPCGFCLPLHFHALFIFLAIFLLPYAIYGQKKICNKMCGLIHSAVVSTQIHIPLPGQSNRPKTFQPL